MPSVSCTTNMSKHCGIILISAFISSSLQCLGCARSKLSTEPPLVQSHDLEVIVVRGPMVVGFFSPAVGGDEHLDWGLDNAAACLEPKGVAVSQVSANSLVFIDGNQRSEYL